MKEQMVHIPLNDAFDCTHEYFKCEKYSQFQN